MPTRPGGELARRPLHFIWITDCSGSMAGEKIAQLNTAIHNVIPEMKRVADANPNAELLVRAVKFSDGAEWHIGTATPIHSFRWLDLLATGVTDLGRALTLVADQLSVPPMAERALPPVLLLISDGQPTDDYKTPLSRLLSLPWGRKAVRIAIAIGRDADETVLQEFIGHPELQPLRAQNATQLTNYIRWASTAVIAAVSAPPSMTKGSSAGHVLIPAPPPSTQKGPAADDVW